MKSSCCILLTVIWVIRPSRSFRQLAGSLESRRQRRHEDVPRLADALIACGREDWVAEECGVVADMPPARRIFLPEDCFQLKGIRALDRRGIAVLRELFVAREAWAHAGGRPPFKVLGNDTLVRLASRRPTNRAGVAAIPGCTPAVMNRYGDGLLQAMARGNAIPEAALPVRPRYARRRVAPMEARRTRLPPVT